MKILEICCYNIDDAILAQQAGADRIELCAGRSDGGLTPSYGLLQAARERISLPVHPIVRPRGGDFHYSPSELNEMMNDIALIKELGFSGVVLGALNCDGQIDYVALKRLLNVANGLSVTFHRAFDVCSDPFLALSQLADLGISRILTSGQQPNAVAGLKLIMQLSEKSTGPIIMPGAGIRVDNIALFNHPLIKEIHSSATKVLPSTMRFRNPNINMGHDSRDEYLNYSVDSAAVQSMKAQLTP